MIDPTSSLPHVSVVTVTFNAAEMVSAFSAAIRNLEYPGIETIIVDNASLDDTVARLGRELPGARVIESPRNLGFAAASNLGARHAAGDILFFLNPDTVPAPDAVASIVRGLWGRPEVGAVGCKLVFADGRLQSAGGHVGPDGRCVHRGWEEPDRGQYETEAIVDYVPGAALAIRRSLFWAVGGFYEGYFPGFYEDADLCLRLHRRGFEVRYLPTPRIVHQDSPSMGAAYEYWMYRNRLLFRARNGEAGRAAAALASEAQWLYYRRVRPLLQSVKYRDGEQLRINWQRLRPLLGGIAAAAVAAPRAVWEARVSRSRVGRHRSLCRRVPREGLQEPAERRLR